MREEACLPSLPHILQVCYTIDMRRAKMNIQSYRLEYPCSAALEGVEEDLKSTTKDHILHETQDLTY